jgi:hypothetical protein
METKYAEQGAFVFGGLADLSHNSKIDRSLEFIKLVLRVVCEGNNIKPGGKLSNFLEDSSFFASVFQAILTVNCQLYISIKNDLEAFLAKVEEFRSKEAEFKKCRLSEEGANLFPAFQKIVAKEAGERELLVVIIGAVKGALNAINDYEEFSIMEEYYLARCQL